MKTKRKMVTNIIAKPVTIIRKLNQRKIQMQSLQMAQSILLLEKIFEYVAIPPAAGVFQGTWRPPRQAPRRPHSRTRAELTCNLNFFLTSLSLYSLISHTEVRLIF